MGSRQKITARTNQVRAVGTVEEKLDAMSHAIDELAEFIDDLESLLQRMDGKIANPERRAG
jgi:hypothetical protein